MQGKVVAIGHVLHLFGLFVFSVLQLWRSPVRAIQLVPEEKALAEIGVEAVVIGYRFANLSSQ